MSPFPVAILQLVIMLDLLCITLSPVLGSPTNIACLPAAFLICCNLGVVQDMFVDYNLEADSYLEAVVGLPPIGLDDSPPDVHLLPPPPMAVMQVAATPSPRSWEVPAI